MISESKLVEFCRIARHDWMNQLQLIKANISLNRLDRIEDIINTIVQESQNESNLSNLKTPKLAAFLLLQKYLNKGIIIHINVASMSLDLSKKDEEITRNLETLLKAIESSTEPMRSPAVEIKAVNGEGRFHLILEITPVGIDKTQLASNLVPLESSLTGHFAKNITSDLLNLHLSWDLESGL